GEFGVPQGTPLLQCIGRHLRDRLRHGEAAVRRKTLEQNVAEGLGRHPAPSGNIFHDSSSTRSRVTSERTNGSLCIFSIAALTAPSRARCSRKMMDASPAW